MTDLNADALEKAKTAAREGVDWPPPLPISNCPCCNGRAQIMPYDGDLNDNIVRKVDGVKWAILCDDFARCRTGQYSGYADPFEAIAAWNRRALPTLSGKEAEAVIAELRATNDWLMQSRLHGHELRALTAGNNALRAAALITALVAERDRMREGLEIAEAAMSIVEPRSDKAKYLEALAAVRAAIGEKKPKPIPKREINDAREVLQRLADGDSIAFSRDGDNAWFTKGDRAWVGDVIIELRAKGYLKRVVDEDAEIDWGHDEISEAGRAALSRAGEK